MLNVRKRMAEKQNTKERKKRMIKAVLLLPIVVVVATILFGVRIALFGAEAAEIEKWMIVWGILMLFLGMLLGVLWVFEAPQESGYWKVMVLSALLGIFPLAFLYPRLSDETLIYIAKPVENPSLNDPIRLLLSGGIDGIMLGTIIGFVVVIIDPQINLGTRFGVLRYLLLTVVVTGVLIGSMVINEKGNFWDIVANFIPLLSVLLLKFGVNQWDKQHAEII